MLNACRIRLMCVQVEEFVGNRPSQNAQMPKRLKNEIQEIVVLTRMIRRLTRVELSVWMRSGEMRSGESVLGNNAVDIAVMLSVGG